MLNIALQDVRNSYDAAMRVPGKTLNVLAALGVTEIVEKQEGIKERHLAISKHPVKMDSGPLKSDHAFKHLTDFPFLDHIHLIP